MNKRHIRGGSRTRLRVEPLEARRLLAGDVTANLADGELLIQGDQFDNGVSITQTVSGTLVVAGYDKGGAPTTINGQPQVFLEGVSGSVRILLAGGNDGLNVGNGNFVRPLALPGDLAIDMGTGLNVVGVGRYTQFAELTWAAPVSTAGDLTINTGALGATDAYLGGVSVGGDLIAALGADPQGVTVFELDSSTTRAEGELSDVAAEAEDVPSTVVGRLAVTVLEGQADISLRNTTVWQPITIQTASYDDRVAIDGFSATESARIETGGGRDAVQLSRLSESRMNSIDIATGGGDDMVRVGQLRTTGELHVHLGEAHVGDQMTMSEATDASIGGRLAIETSGPADVRVGSAATRTTVRGALSYQGGAGEDVVLFRGLRVQRGATIATTGANDAIYIQDCRFQGDTYVNSGGGADAVQIGSTATVDSWANFYGPLSIYTGDQADVLTVNDVRVFGETFVDLGAATGGRDRALFAGTTGYSRYRDLQIYGGGASDIQVGGGPSLPTYVWGRLWIDTEAGLPHDDNILLDGALLWRSSRILTGAGRDTVRIQRSGLVGDVIVDTGDDEDTIHVADTVMWRDVALNGGDATDTFYIARNYIFARLGVYGGDGVDFINREPRDNWLARRAELIVDVEELD